MGNECLLLGSEHKPLLIMMDTIPHQVRGDGSRSLEHHAHHWGTVSIRWSLKYKKRMMEPLCATSVHGNHCIRNQRNDHDGIHTMVSIMTGGITSIRSDNLV